MIAHQPLLHSPLLLVLLHNRLRRLIHGNRAFVITFGFNLWHHWAFALACNTTVDVLMPRNSTRVAVAFISARRRLIVAMFASGWCSSCCSWRFRCRSRCCFRSLLTHLLATSCKHCRNDQRCQCQLGFDFHRLSLFHCLRKAHTVQQTKAQGLIYHTQK